MADEWFFTQNGQQAGPVDFSVLQQMAMNRQLQPMELVWKQGMANWAPAHSMPGIFQGPPQPPPAYAPPPPPPGYQQPPLAPLSGYPGQGGYMPQNPGYGMPQYAPVVGKDYYVMARTSMILALVGLLLFGFITGILAIVYASKAMNGMKQTGNFRGKGMAVAGLVIGILDILGWCAYLSGRRYYG